VSVVVAGTGSFVPEQTLTNHELERLVETDDAWIRARTGIAERHVVARGEATSDLARRAGRGAIEQAGIAPGDLDLIVVATVTPDMLFPSVATLVHRDLRVGRPIPCFDLSAACAGFTYGLEVVRNLVGGAGYQRALLIGSEALTRFVDYEDRGTCILFGDGAGAVVLESSNHPTRGVRSTVLKSDGEFWDLIHLPGGGSRRPGSPYMLAQREQYLRMNGRQVFKLAVQALEQVARDAIDQAGWKLDEVDHFLFHQANQRILEAVSERLGLNEARVPTNIERTGNTSAASVPLLLDECNRAGRLSPGDKIVCAGFGAGLVWGAATLEWGSETQL
jgi:3-oxoacyl-[acyl-carrier-protein] synthase-3